MAVNVSKLTEKLKHVHSGVKNVFWYNPTHGLESPGAFGERDQRELILFKGSVEVSLDFYCVELTNCVELARAELRAGLDTALEEVIKLLQPPDDPDREEYIDCFYMGGVYWGFRGHSAVIPQPVTPCPPKRWKVHRPFQCVNFTEEYHLDGLTSITSQFVAVIAQI